MADMGTRIGGIAGSNMSDDIERFCDPLRQHPILGHPSRMVLECCPVRTSPAAKEPGAVQHARALKPAGAKFTDVTGARLG